ncbi:MAG: halocarboxylic acid dehydrogenase DehI family protein [Dehalococcoidia bacterium]
MTGERAVQLDEVASALRAPFVPRVFERLTACDGYLDAVWPQIAPAVETAGFLGSALYLADMALDAVTETYEPVLSRDSLAASGVLGAADADALLDVLDAFHWVQPQALLIAAALAEAFEAPRVGGEGRAEPRALHERERRHLVTQVRLAPPEQPPLPAIASALQLDEAPTLYRAVAVWPGTLDAAWAEVQHLSAYPPLRRRARALYYYARSSARFLAVPIEADAAALRARGVGDAAIASARAAVEASLPELATMVVHCCALRAALGVTTREVVRD